MSGAKTRVYCISAKSTHELLSPKIMLMRFDKSLALISRIASFFHSRGEDERHRGVGRKDRLGRREGKREGRGWVMQRQIER